MMIMEVMVCESVGAIFHIHVACQSHSRRSFFGEADKAKNTIDDIKVIFKICAMHESAMHGRILQDSLQI